MEIKKYIVKYLLIVIGLGILNILVNYFMPELFIETIVGDGFTQSRTTFIGLYQSNILNLILAIIMLFDLNKIRSNMIIIPVLTVISMTAGLFFFSILVLDKLIKNHESI